MTTQNTPATVDFHGHALTVITGPNGEKLVAIRPICESIGLSWQGQNERIKRDEVLKEGVRVIRTPSAGGEQDTMCLPLDYLNGWLFGIDVTRCREAIRPTLIQYKRECYAVLAAYWLQGEAINPRADAVTPAETPAAIDVRHCLLDGLSTPTVALPDDVQRALDQRAFAMAGEAFELCREHLARRVAHASEMGHPRAINRKRALAVIAEATLGQALAQAHYRQVRTVLRLAETLADMADQYHTDLRALLDRPAASLPA